MKRAVKKKVEADETGVLSILRSQFRSFAKLTERAAEGRPLLRGLRVAHDPSADRFVVVHGGSRIEFVLGLQGDARPPGAEVLCRRMDTAGATDPTPIARFRFDETGAVVDSSVPELVGERIDQTSGAWSIVAAVIWNALVSPA
jgi:hypothetical protein